MLRTLQHPSNISCTNTKSWVCLAATGSRPTHLQKPITACCLRMSAQAANDALEACGPAHAGGGRATAQLLSSCTARLTLLFLAGVNAVCLVADRPAAAAAAPVLAPLLLPEAAATTKG